MNRLAKNTKKERGVEVLEIDVRCAKRSRGFQHKVELHPDGTASFLSHLNEKGKPHRASFLSHEAQIALKRNNEEDAGRYAIDRGCYALACFITGLEKGRFVCYGDVFTKVDPGHHSRLSRWLKEHVLDPRAAREEARKVKDDCDRFRQTNRNYRWTEVWGARENLSIMREVEALGRMGGPQARTLSLWECRTFGLPVGYRCLKEVVDHLQRLDLRNLGVMPLP